MQKKIFTEQEKEFIKNNLLEKKSLSWIAQQLDCCTEVVGNEAVKIMGPGFDMKHKSYITKDYFHTIDTPEKAYWVGFLAADGTIVNDEIIITLQPSDKLHLQKFSDTINAKLTIRDINQKTNLSDTTFHLCRVSTRCQQMCDDLKALGIHQNKSLDLLPPTNIPDNLINYWIIGYMDGDGCVTKNKKKMRVCFTGTYEVIQFIHDWVGSSGVIRLEHRCEHTYRIQLENDLSLRFLMKNDYINLPFALERKKDIVRLYSSLIQ